MASEGPNDEARPLLSPPPNPNDTDSPSEASYALLKFIIAVTGNVESTRLLAAGELLDTFIEISPGVFLVNADTSLVVATYPTIASEFKNLTQGPWMLTGYTLGFSVALPAVSVYLSHAVLA